MTAMRTALFTLSIVATAFAAGQLAQGASPLDCGSAGCVAPCGPVGAISCTGCDASCGPSEKADFSNDFDLRCWFNPQLAAEYEACCQDFWDICQGSTWKADVSVLILERTSPGTRTVLFDPTTGAGIFDASRLNFPVAAGPRVSVTALDCEGWGLEVNYFGIDGWSSVRDFPTTGLPAGGNLAIDGIQTPLSLTTAHFDSTARLYSGELNFRKPLIGDIAILAGFRWVELADRYYASGMSATTLNTASETILTHNHMYGFQLGADGILAKQPDRWKITGFVKGGIFLNEADQATSLSDPGGLGTQTASNDNHVGAFFGEAGFTGFIQLTKHLSASAGYQVIFINNVAQPVNQIAGMDLATSAAVVDTSAGLFYHGASVGMEVTW
jgi:hypothetical protein